MYFGARFVHSDERYVTDSFIFAGVVSLMFAFFLVVVWHHNGLCDRDEDDKQMILKHPGRWAIVMAILTSVMYLGAYFVHKDERYVHMTDGFVFGGVVSFMAAGFFALFFFNK